MENKYREICTYPMGLKPENISWVKSDGLISGKNGGEYQEAWQTTNKLRPNDTNGSKPAVKRIEFSTGSLIIESSETDYFTLWGLPKAFPEKFNNGKDQLLTSGNASIPFGIGTHNIVYSLTDQAFLGRLSGGNGGYASGRASVSFEEQVEISDKSLGEASLRGAEEELNLDPDEIRQNLLGVCVEEGAAYVTLGFLLTVNQTLGEIVNKAETAIDHSETTAWLKIPRKNISSYQGGRVSNDLVVSNLITSPNLDIPEKINTHPTTDWRIGLIVAAASCNPDLLA